jgi:two-component system, OmpR family, KDP operon response regulator KdpE
MPDKKRILVVDDEPQITRVLRTALTGSGYEVRTADDGHSGLRSAREWQPDLVITDVSMPNMSGIELCRQLRAESTLPIIVLSVKGEEKTKVEALDAGADDYVTKPISWRGYAGTWRGRSRPKMHHSEPSRSAISKLMRTHSGWWCATAKSGLLPRNSNF